MTTCPLSPRAGGTAAIVAGALRVLMSFNSIAAHAPQQLLYFVIDLLLLIGVVAVFAGRRQLLGRSGATGFVFVVVGIGVVRFTRAFPGIDLYPAGALAIVGGWILLSAAWWGRARGSALVPLLFGFSLLTGLIGQLMPDSAALFVVSGVVFGAAMIAVGRQLVIAAHKHSDTWRRRSLAVVHEAVFREVVRQRARTDAHQLRRVPLDRICGKGAAYCLALRPLDIFMESE